MGVEGTVTWEPTSGRAGGVGLGTGSETEAGAEGGVEEAVAVAVAGAEFCILYETWNEINKRKVRYRDP